MDKQLITWSVQTESSNWSDDIFCGTFDECVQYCSENDIKIDGVEAQLAKIEIDPVTKCFLYTHDIVTEL